MLMPDVNVLVTAHRADAPHHEAVRAWLETAVNGTESVGVSDAVATGFVRVVTHRRIFREPTSLEKAIAQLDALFDAGALHVTAAETAWPHFRALSLAADARGNLVADAAHAATAVQAGATWVSLDRDFARFDGLRWRSPLEA